jgi:arabinose-5-phosphate isomerase
MLKELFTLKRQYINYFFEHMDHAAAEQFLQTLCACEGTMVFTGIGKSGLIAKKIAVTMTSTGSKASFLSPTNALHGDLGILNAKDVFVLLSKSGETEELLNLIPYLRNKGVKLLCIVSNGKSRLAKACDFAVTLPLEKELCPFNLAPTTSTSIQLMFGDIMAIALMRHKNFSLDQYALNHPAGSIGKRMIVKVKDLMLADKLIPLCKPKDKLVDTLVELSNKRCGCVLIVDDNMIMQGIFTDGDLRRSLLNKGPDVLHNTMEQLMTKTPRHINPEVLAWDAMRLMEADQRNAITCLPVIDENRKVHGLIKLHDIIQSGL